MASSRLLIVLVLASVMGLIACQQPPTPSAVEMLQGIYSDCLSQLSVSCVKPRAMRWFEDVVDGPVVKITEDLVVVKKDLPEDPQEQRGMPADIFDRFEDFLQSHDLVARVPEVLKPAGPFGSFLARSFQPEDLSVPLAATGRSKMVKKVIMPFLIGLKFKTAVLVPLALALIALKTWKALTLGLLSLVLTGALVIFRLSKPKVTTYEVVHYPHHHVEHHVEHPVPVPSGWEHPGYGRGFSEKSAQEMAYGRQVLQ